MLCLVGFGAMVIRGGDRRMLAIAAAGTYVIYTVLTCLFYFVGLAYENVSEATRFILFIGALDAAWFLAQRAYSRVLAPRGSAVSRAARSYFSPSSTGGPPPAGANRLARVVDRVLSCA
jgi:hypothetical protein